MNIKCRDFARKIGICLAFFVMISAFFYVPMSVEASASGSVVNRTTVRNGDNMHTVFISFNALDEELTSLEEGKLYKISYEFDYYLDTDITDGSCRVIDAEAKLQLPDNNEDWYSNHIALESWYAGSRVLDANGDYNINSKGIFYFSAVPYENNAGDYCIDVEITLYSDVSTIINYSSGYTLGYTSIEMLSADEEAIYKKGYEDGYTTGEANGETSGYNSGYDTGYDVGYAEGEASVDTEQYYQDGYNNGYGVGYADGYSEGEASVETEQYYQSGYDAGYAAAYDLAYDNGYEVGYAEGYARIKSLAESSGTVQGESFEVSDTIDISDTTLNLDDCNTLLDLEYSYSYNRDYELEYKEYWYDADGSYDSVTDDGLEDGDYLENGEGYIFSDVLYWSSEKWRYLAYSGQARDYVFTADPSAYAYKIDVSYSNIAFTSNNVKWARHTMGTRSDVLSGDSELGRIFRDGSDGSFSFFVVTDNLPVDVYSAVLFYFYSGDNVTANYDLSATLDYTITPYSRTEYAGVLESMDDIKDNIDQNFDNLVNGYDSSAGDSMNDSFSASVNDYQIAEDSLFASAKSGLEDFEFFDFQSIPAVITGLSFVGALMTSIFNAMGGLSGGGIVLSVLFSVMLIAMIIGLYKFYTSSGDDGDDIGDPPNHVPRIGLKK